MLEKLKQYQEQRKQLERRKKEEERKIRTHRLIQIGGAVESVLGRAVTEEDVPKLIAFLKKQEANGRYFSKAMQHSTVPNTAEGADEGDGTLPFPLQGNEEGRTYRQAEAVYPTARTCALRGLG